MYPGSTTDLCNIVGRDAFLEALANPSLRVRFLEKAPTTMEEALRIASNLEALDKSKETEAKISGGLHERVVKQPRKTKDGYAKVAAKSVSTPTVESKAVETSSTLAEVSQLCNRFSNCRRIMHRGFVCTVVSFCC